MTANTIAGILIARHLGATGRGEISYAFLLMSVGSTVASLGLDHSSTRVLAPQDLPSRADLLRIVKLVLASGTVISCFFTIAAMLWRPPVGVTGVLVGILGYTVVQTVTPAALACGRILSVASTRIFCGLAYLVIVILLSTTSSAAASFVWAWSGTGVLLASGVTLSAWRSTFPADTPTATRTLLSLGRSGWQASLAQAINYRFDQVVLLSVAGAAALGKYSVAVFAMNALWLLADGLAELEYPAGTRLQAEERWQRAKALSRRVCMAVGAVGALGTGLSLFLVKPVLGADFEEVPLLLLLLLPGTVAIAAGKIAGAALYSAGEGRLVRNVVYRTAAVVLIGTLPVIAVAGTVGAALFSSFAYMLLALQMWSALRRSAGSAREMDRTLLRPHNPDGESVTRGQL